MRDPNLIVRAQQAAAELERAWDRWRTLHGLGIDPPPPVSSYVGYSLEEPWGQPRVVFGIDAREAEQLAALLDRHDCNGPVYASVASLAATRTAEATEARAPEADRNQGAGRVRVPTQAQPVTAQREGPPESAQRDNGTHEEEPGAVGAGRQAQEPATADHELSARRADQSAETVPHGPPAFRPRLEPAAYPDEDEDLDPAVAELEPEPEPAPTAEPSRATAGWTRASRVPGGHALSRQKRTARGASAKQQSKDRSGPEAMAAELAGWTAGELPGQVSRLC